PRLRGGQRPHDGHAGPRRGEPAQARARRPAVRGRRLLRHPRASLLRLARWPPYALRGRAADARGGDMTAQGRYFGVYPAIVTKIVDPDSLGRVEVQFPWLGKPDGD